VIVARTDAIAVEGFEAGLDRAAAYLEAGADVLFIEALQTREQLAEAGRRFGARVPLLANMVEGGKTPMLPLPELAALGFRIAIYPGAMVRVLGHAAREYLRVLRTEGSTLSHRAHMLDFTQLNALIGTDVMLRDGQKYDPGNS
jgi:2-methylisocitrate lyase-like PEP mutase family enzyme